METSARIPGFNFPRGWISFSSIANTVVSRPDAAWMFMGVYSARFDFFDRRVERIAREGIDGYLRRLPKHNLPVLALRNVDRDRQLVQQAEREQISARLDWKNNMKKLGSRMP